MDGDGNRVQKSHGKIYWYGAGTEILEETDATGSMTNASFSEYVYFAGKRVTRHDGSGNFFFYLQDDLGTTDGMVEITSGQTAEAPCYDADFYPYGGEKVYTNTCPQNYKFEGKERDAETSNDDFGARYYSSTLGRFLSADWSAIPVPVPYANLSNPQTLNLYAIVHDNPETFADLDGHDCQGNGDSCESKKTPDESPDSTSNSSAQTGASGNTPTGQSTDKTAKPQSKPAPTNPDGTPKPPSVPVPGHPELRWEWHRDESNPRKGTWGPERGTWDGAKWGSPPSASWEGTGHWDVDNGSGVRQRYDENAKPVPPDHASSSIASRASNFIHAHPIATGVGAGVVILGATAAIIFSGGTAGPPLAAAAAAF